MKEKLHPRLSACLAAALAGVVILFLAGSEVHADDPSAHHAGLVVVDDDGKVKKKCVEFSDDSIDGMELLRRSGLDVIIDETGSAGSIVCKINGCGCDFPEETCFCQCKGTPCYFWSYWHLKNGSWQFSNSGASSYTIHDGMVDGWAWGEGSAGGGPRILPAVSYEELCSPATATATPPPTATLTPLPTDTPTEAPPTATKTPKPSTRTPTPTNTASPSPSASATGAAIMALAVKTPNSSTGKPSKEEPEESAGSPATEETVDETAAIPTTASAAGSETETPAAIAMPVTTADEEAFESEISLPEAPSSSQESEKRLYHSSVLPPAQETGWLNGLISAGFIGISGCAAVILVIGGVILAFWFLGRRQGE